MFDPSQNPQADERLKSREFKQQSRRQRLGANGFALSPDAREGNGAVEPAVGEPTPCAPSCVTGDQGPSPITETHGSRSRPQAAFCGAGTDR